MIDLASDRRRWLVVAAFAAAMAWLESATVYYLRLMFDRIEPFQQNPLPLHGVIGPVELVREAATLLMLLAAGALAGRTTRTRLGYAAIAFGIWDVLYYVFLRAITGWPKTPLDWDVLFLLPLPWWGPVLAPVCIAVLLIAWGTLTTQAGDREPATVSEWHVWTLSALGAALALYLFMADALRATPRGLDAVRNVLPEAFNWPAFATALALMAAPVVRLLSPPYPPAMAPTTRNGSVPFATASGSGASGRSCDRSCSQA